MVIGVILHSSRLGLKRSFHAHLLACSSTTRAGTLPEDMGLMVHWSTGTTAAGIKITIIRHDAIRTMTLSVHHLNGVSEEKRTMKRNVLISI